MFIGKFNRAILITLIGTLSVMIGCYLSLVEGNITAAIICLVIAGVSDMFDGKVARSMKKRDEDDKEYGIQIDSLADTVAFVVYPIIILYAYLLKNKLDLNSVMLVMVSTLFIACGVTRLAYFNTKANKVDGPVKYYSGFPVTTSAMFFPLLYLFKSFMSIKVFAYVYVLMLIVIAFLFIVNVKIKKPKGNLFYIVVPIIALAAITALILL